MSQPLPLSNFLYFPTFQYNILYTVCQLHYFRIVLYLIIYIYFYTNLKLFDFSCILASVKSLGDRLMVGRVPLAHAIGVRVPVPQPHCLNN